MTQNNLATMVSPTPGATLVSNLENWRDALHSMHSGASRPDYVVPQMMWIDTSETPWVLKVFQGSDDIVLGSLDPSSLLFSPSSVAAGSIGTSNIIDGSVTKEKLSTAVQSSLDKADTAVQTSGVALSKYFESAEQTITNNSSVTIAHGLGERPKLFQLFIRVKVANNGYAVGDEIVIPYSNNGTSGERLSALTADQTNIVISTRANVEIPVKNGSASGVNIVDPNFKFFVRAFA